MTKPQVTAGGVHPFHRVDGVRSPGEVLFLHSSTEVLRDPVLRFSDRPRNRGQGVGIAAERNRIPNCVSEADIKRRQRNRTADFASKVFNIFEAWEWRGQRKNPCRGVERAREEARDRVLSPSELSDLFGALSAEEQRNPAAVAAIRFAVVTGLRISAVLGIQWQHVKSGRLLLPGTKTGRRWHDLPAPAIEVLGAVRRIDSEIGGWVFLYNGGPAPVGYQTTRAVFARAAKRAGLADVRLHDLGRVNISPELFAQTART